MTVPASNKYIGLLIICLLCAYLHGCHSIIYDDEEMHGYQVLIKIYGSTAINDSLPEVLKDFAERHGFSEVPQDKSLPDWEKCVFFYKNLGSDFVGAPETSAVVLISCCQIDKASFKYAIDMGDFEAAVYSWHPESASVKTEIDRLGQMIYELIKSNGVEEMTLRKRRIGYR